MNTLIQQECGKLIKTVETFVMVQMISISNKCCSCEIFVLQRILKEMYFSIHKNIKAVLNINNNKKFYLSTKSAY